MIIRKFISDFVRPVPVLAEESVDWIELPGKHFPELSLKITMDCKSPHADYLNDNAYLRFRMFFQTRPNYIRVIVLIRGIDGASINPDSWIGLQTRYPNINIVLAFSCTEDYVRFRGPVGHDFFFKTNPDDERVYCFFQFLR